MESAGMVGAAKAVAARRRGRRDFMGRGKIQVQRCKSAKVKRGDTWAS
jgi:hypothetical protein